MSKHRLISSLLAFSILFFAFQNAGGTPPRAEDDFLLPRIGVATSASAPVIQANGSYNITYTVTVKNYGDEKLTSVQVTDALALSFVSPATYTLVGNVVATGTLIANTNFNGNTDINLLAAASTLSVGVQQTILFTVNVVANGSFGPFISLPTASGNGTALPVLDTSTNGNNPDPNGDNIPIETSPTTVSLVPFPVIGVAKRAAAPLVQANGSYNITYTVTIKNLGNELLTSVQVDDPLNLVFPAPATYTVGSVTSTGALVANTGYNGNGTTSLLAAGSKLGLSETQSITFTVNVVTNGLFGPFLNTATASGKGSSLTSTDISVDGNNPDPNGDGLPLETFPTSVTLVPTPVIGVAKSASTPLAQPDGSNNVTFTITVKNLGNEALHNVQVTDALIGVFIGPATYSLVGGIAASGTLSPNAGFNGNLNANLLTAGASTLAVGATQTISFTVNVKANGLLGPFTNSAVATALGSLLPTTDISVDGNNPDPNGDGIPAETSLTVVSLLPVPIIGVAKSAGSPALQPDGSYNVPFTITIKNMGNEILNNVQVTDLLTNTFVGPSTYSIVGNVLTSGNLVANAGFNGGLQPNLLQAGSSLAVGTTQTILFTVNVHPNGIFGLISNTAVASANGSILPTTDISVDGTNPDPNGDGLPLETLPTIVTFVPSPVIGIAKSATAPQAQSDGTYNVTFTMTVENLGNEALTNVQVTDLLTSAFIGPSTYTLVGNVVASGTLIANSTYNGSTIGNLLAAGSTLAVGSTQTVAFTVNVKPNTAFGPFLNTAIASGLGSLLPTTDISVDGNNPDPNGDGLPLETLPTIVNLVPLPLIGLAKSATSPTIQPDGSYNIVYTFTVKNMGNEPLTNVQVTDNMVGVFASPSVYKLVGGVATSGSLVANAGFDGGLGNNLLAAGSTLGVGETQTISTTLNVQPNALFGPFVNTAVATGQGSLLPTTDLSMDGNNPDPNGDGLPLETLPTIVNLIPLPVIGVSKNASTPLLQPDGSYNVTFTMTVKNYGNENLTSVQVTDLLISVLPPPSLFTIVAPPTATGTLIANPGYNGNLISNLLLTGSTLSVGDKQTISFTINIKPNLVFGPFVNTAVATASGSLLPTTDVSMDGNNPDPNGDGIPLELLPTTILLLPAPSIGVAKNIITSILQPDGSYNVTYGVTVKNYGNVDLHNVAITDDLASAFNLSTGFSIAANASSTGGLQADVSFDGISDPNLLKPLNSVLGVGETQTITYGVNIKAGGVFGPYCNSVLATATGPGGIGITADVSETGTNPDPDGNGIPTENSCTQLRLTSNPVIGLAKSASVPALQANGSYNVQYTFTVKNLGNTALTGVQVTDDLSSAFPSPATFSLTGAPTTSGTLVVNSSYNGAADKNLLGAASTLAIGASATITVSLNIVPNGNFGPYFNTAQASADDAASTSTTNDTSTDGTNPDPNGNGNPGDTGESVPTPVSLTPNALVGVAKAASSPAVQADGSYNITLTFTVANLGNVGLVNVQVTDNLVSVFPSPSTYTIAGVTSTSSLLPNTSYNGNTDVNLLAVGSTLAVGASEHITVTMNVMPNGSFGPFFNSAFASAKANGFSNTTSDTSTDGNNPDPNNNHNPSDTGEDTPTTISLSPNPIIGAAKSVTSSILQSNGSYAVTFAITVKNYGNVALNNIQVTDDLTAAFSSPTTFTISQAASATGGLTPNASYNGGSDINLLAAGNTLAPGASQTITFSANILVNGNFGPFYNSAKATGTGAAGSGGASDISTSGTNPDPNGNGNPSDAGENVATPISLTPNPVMGIAKAASVPQIQSDGSYKVTYTVTIKNLGNVAFTNVQVTDNLASTFTSPATFSLSGAAVVSGSITPNGSFNGTTDVNLLAAGNTLPIGVTESITFNVTIQPNGSFGPFNNSAAGTATSTAGNYSDISAPGTNPDPNGNGNPGDPGENDATAVTLTPQPILGVAKSASTPTLQSDGSSHITYTIILKNMGNVALTNVQVTDDLKSTFVAPATFSLVGAITASGLLTANSSFDGNTVTSLLSAGTIATGTTQTITFTVDVQPNGSFGPFFNSAVGKGTSGSSTYTDISNSGTNPDPNGNGNPGDAGEDTATPVTLSPSLIAGIAKAASLPLLQPDGSYKVTYTLAVENLGSSNVNNIQVKDYLSSAFPAPVTFTVVPGSAATGSLVINPSFDGVSDVNLLAAGSKLPIGASHTITYSIIVSLDGASGIFYNRATVTTVSDDNLSSYTDISSNGTNPDPNGNGNPGDVGENDPTPVTLTPHGVLGIAKAAGLPLQQTDGSFDVIYTITAENLGNVTLNQVQVTDNLLQAFPSPATFTVSNVTTTGTLPVNTGFNGGSDVNLFTVGNTLGIGLSTKANFTVHITPNGSTGTFYNSASGSAIPAGTSGTTTDVSANGTNPDPNGNGNPGDAGEDGATPVTLILSPVIGIAKAVSIPILNTTTGAFDVTFTLTVENLGNTDLANVKVLDDLSLIFPAGTIFTIKGSVISSGTLITNTSYDGMANVNLLDAASTLPIGKKQTIVVTISVASAIGPGPYYNSALAFASNPDASLTYGDISTSGSNPDPNDNGNPNDPNESIPTSFLLDLIPIIGVAEEASVPVLKSDGTYDVTLTVTVENLGNEILKNITLSTDLRNTFPSVVDYTITAVPADAGTLLANDTFDGNLQKNLLKGGTLDVGETEVFTFSINITPNNAFGLFYTQVNATATGDQTGFITTDISDNGTNPDPDGNGLPDALDENDPTPIDLIPHNKFRLALFAGVPVSNTSCIYDASYTFTIANFGNSIIKQFNIKDSLAAVFKAPTVFSVVSITSTTGLHANPSFDGGTNPWLLSGVDSIKTGETGSVTLIVRISPNGQYGPYLNTATLIGTGPDATLTTDESENGESPDSSENQNPDTPTPVSITPAGMFFPNAFSPNGDGMHDTYDITLSCELTARLLIYNRWGDKVFDEADYKNDWNGFSNQGSFLGKPLPDATYFYTIELSNGQRYTSFITLKR